jgi:hypothetical protein
MIEDGKENIKISYDHDEYTGNTLIFSFLTPRMSALVVKLVAMRSSKDEQSERTNCCE